MLIYFLFLRVACVEESQEFVNPQTSLRDWSKRFFFFKSNHSYNIIGLHVSTWSLSAAWQVLRMWNSQRDEKEARECDWLRLDVIWGIKLVAFYYFLFFWRVCDDEQDKKKQEQASLSRGDGTGVGFFFCGRLTLILKTCIHVYVMSIPCVSAFLHPKLRALNTFCILWSVV